MQAVTAGQLQNTAWAVSLSRGTAALGTETISERVLFWASETDRSPPETPACNAGVVGMKPPHLGVCFFEARRALAWGALLAVTVALAFLVQALAARALGGPEPSSPTPCQTTARAALADGDDIRARFLAQACAAPT